MSSARLFQTIVVAGTSIGACASNVESVPHNSSGAATGAGGATTVSTGTVSASVATSSNANSASTGSGVIVGSGGAGGGSVTSPSDCANSAQFQCQTYVPAYTNCYCDPDAPLSAKDCGNEPMFFTCYSYNPPIGCHCIAPIK